MNEQNVNRCTEKELDVQTLSFVNLTEENRGRKLGVRNSRSITEEEARILMTQLYLNGYKREHLLMLIAFNTRLSLDDIVMLKVGDFIDNNGEVMEAIRCGVIDTIPIGKDVADYIKSYLNDKNFICDATDINEFVFKAHNRDSKTYKGGYISYVSLLQNINTFIKTNFIPFRNFKELRIGKKTFEVFYQQNAKKHRDELLRKSNYKGNFVGVVLEKTQECLNDKERDV